MILSLSIAKAGMQILRDTPSISLVQLDISEEMYNKVKSDIPWTGEDKNRVKRTIDALITGSLDAIGTSQFEVSAEYVAAAIGMFVHPGNIMKACAWMEGGMPNSQLAVPSGTTPAVSATADQLFALVLGLYGSVDCCEYRDLFEHRTGLAMKKHARKTAETPA